MWYFSWLLGLPLAAAFAVLNAMWYELIDSKKKEDAAKAAAESKWRGKSARNTKNGAAGSLTSTPHAFRHESNSSKSGNRFCVRNCAKTGPAGRLTGITKNFSRQIRHASHPRHTARSTLSARLRHRLSPRISTDFPALPASIATGNPRGSSHRFPIDFDGKFPGWAT